MSNKHLVIIGGGATGCCVAVNLYEQFKNLGQITIIDPNETIGLGKAYTTQDDENILNVPADNMGLIVDNPNHFVQWLQQQGRRPQDFPYWPFVSRKVFGQYIQACLSHIKYDHINSKVIQVKRHTHSYKLILNDGKSIVADMIVTATGYQEDRNIFSRLINKDQTPRLLYSLEAEKTFFREQDRILIIGSGLTAIDLWKRIRRFGSKITMLSRHGLLPMPHGDFTNIPRFPNLKGMTPLQIFEVVRSLQKASGCTWQKIADEIRPQSRNIWTCWSAQEKKQFLRYLRPYWEIIRHRTPAPINDMLQQDITAGSLLVKAAKILSINSQDDTLQVISKSRHTLQDNSEVYHYIILATGAVIDQCLFQGITGVKFSTNAFGYINTSAPNIWFAGPSSKATFWEIAAIPDIRTQCKGIVKQIMKCASENKRLSWSALEHHPISIGETYGEHFVQAIGFSFSLIGKAAQSIVHAFLPYHYTDKTSNDLRDFSIKLAKRRRKDI